MFTYYLELALRSLRRNKVLTALMVVAIALGIGACMTTLTVLHVLSGDPIPAKSARLFYPQLDPQDMEGYREGEEPPAQLTWTDGMNLLKARRAQRQALMTGGAVPVQPAQSDLEPFFSDARYTSADFFAMFDTPFLYGQGWSAADDDAKARVVVLTRNLNQKLFGGKDSRGQIVRMKDTAFRVVGVLDDWRPNPHFYDLNMGNYSDAEEVFIPLSTSRDLLLPRNGSMDCWGKGAADGDHLENATCVWMQFWVELESPSQAAAYKAFLENYSREQKALGRFQRPVNVRLRNVMEWLDHQKVVPSDVRLQSWLAIGFLVVCLVNTVGLMLAKFLRRAGELGVRRALGASKLEVFKQLLVEAAVVGVAGGVLGLGLAFLGLWLVRHQPADYASLAHLDLFMLGVTFALAVGSSMAAGLLPAWRACQITPALQLKSQ
jgi:putative ABC transport system permease protein